MKLVRRLSKHGNCLHVSLPNALLDQLRWRGGDRIIVELTPEFELKIRRPRGADILDADLPSIQLDAPAAAPTR